MVKEWALPLSNIREVKKVSQDEGHIVIDVRENDRYRGLTEPIDLIAGHIPGAVNVPFHTNLGDHGLFLSPEELKNTNLFLEMWELTKLSFIVVQGSQLVILFWQ